MIPTLTLMPFDTSPLKRIMDPAASSSSATTVVTNASLVASGVSGLLREGWTGISEVLTTATTPSSSSIMNPTISIPTPTANVSTPSNPVVSTSNTNSSPYPFTITAPPAPPPPPPLALNTSGLLGLTPNASTPTPSTAAAAAGDLLELTSRLTRQLKRAEETCRRIEVREKNRVEVLKRCLIACCAKESAEVLEMALEIAINEDPDVERDSREFKELLIVRSKPDEQIEAELDRVASLERELKEERAARAFAEEEKAVVEARLRTQQEAWQAERERFVNEQKNVQDLVNEQLAEERKVFAARIATIEQSNKDRMQLETANLMEKVRTLEARLEMEMSINKQRKELEEARSSAAVKNATDENNEEIEYLRRKVAELEDASRPQRELLFFVKSQAEREKVVRSLENEVMDLKSRCSSQELQITDLTNQLEGAVPSECLGPARGDYLRHVVFKYLTFENMAQRQTLIPVIAMLLNFSPEEKKICESSAARDVAKEGVIGSLSASFQTIPMFTGGVGASVAHSSSAVHISSPPTRRLIPAPPAGRYAPVATIPTGISEQNGL